MGFSSYDDLMSETTENGKTTEIVYYNKVTGGVAYTAGRVYDFSALNGSPVANQWAGTALQWRGCDEATGNGTQIFGIPHEGNVSPDTKHLSIAALLSQAPTGVPGFWQLVDMQGYWPGINMNLATAQVLSGVPALRYANGIGVRPYLVATATVGATAHNITMSYTNQLGVAGRALGPVVAGTPSAITPHLVHTGLGANNYAPFLPLGGGDRGVQNVAQVQLSAASGGGTAALVLARPLGPPIPVTQAGVLSERDLVNQLRSQPRIRDGACLTALFYAGSAVAANSGFVGYVSADWG